MLKLDRHTKPIATCVPVKFEHLTPSRSPSAVPLVWAPPGIIPSTPRTLGVVRGHAARSTAARVQDYDYGVRCDHRHDIRQLLSPDPITTRRRCCCTHLDSFTVRGRGFQSQTSVSELCTQHSVVSAQFAYGRLGMRLCGAALR